MYDMYVQLYMHVVQFAPPPPQFFLCWVPLTGVWKERSTVYPLLLADWVNLTPKLSLYIYRVSKGDNRHLLSPYIGLGMGDNRHLLSTFISNVYRLKGALYNANYALFISLVRVKTKQNIE